jgi:hypothetical protein
MPYSSGKDPVTFANLNDAWEVGPGWSNEKKTYDRAKPFHRINSPSYDTLVDQFPGQIGKWRKKAAGNGYDCGCRSSSDYKPEQGGDLLKLITDAFGVPTSLTDLYDKLANFPGADQVKDQLTKVLKDHGLDPDFDLAKFLGNLAESEIFGGMLRLLPAWVPVNRGTDDKKKEEEYREIEGFLWNSFLDWSDIPFSQWHQWYDWTFQVIPYRAYSYLQSDANRYQHFRVNDSISADQEFNTDDPGDFLPLAARLPSGTADPGSRYAFAPFECKWDSGAMRAKGDTADVKGPFVPPMMAKAGATQETFSELADWCWPQPGSYVWMSGRWVYDCLHPTSNQKPEKGKTAGEMRTQLHPCRAIATARWEAVQFDDPTGKVDPKRPRVPAIQFMFYADRRGGYVDYPGDGNPDEDETFEFIVDLPQRPPPSGRDYPIGSTHPVDSKNRFPLNRLVFASAPMQTRFDFKPFISVGAPQSGDAPLPEIELLTPDDPSSAYLQAKVTIKLGKLPVYGVIVSLGWEDVDGSQAAKVKEVHVNLDHYRKHSVDHDVLAEEWRLNLSVNGRWLQVFNDGVHDNTDLPVKQEIVLYLAPEDELSICAHGMEQDAEGDWFDHDDRVLKHLVVEFDPLPVDINQLKAIPAWARKLGKIPNIKGFDKVNWKDFDDHDKPDNEKASGFARDLRIWGFPAWALPNDILGHLNPHAEGRPPISNPADDFNEGLSNGPVNQISVKNLLAGAGANQTAHQTAYEWRSENDSGKLPDTLELQFWDRPFGAGSPERKEKRDFTVHYSIELKDQPKP